MNVINNGNWFQKLRIGILRDPFWNTSDASSSDDIIPVLEKCLETLKENGLADVVDPARAPFQHKIDRQKGNSWIRTTVECHNFSFVNISAADLIFLHEFKHSVNIYLKDEVQHSNVNRNRTIFSLADVIRFNELNPSVEGYKQNLLRLSEQTNGLNNDTYISALNAYRKDSISYLDAIFYENNVDALATPCMSSICQSLYSFGAAAGYPSLTVSFK